MLIKQYNQLASTCKFSQMLQVHHLIGISQSDFRWVKKLTMRRIHVLLFDGEPI